MLNIKKSINGDEFQNVWMRDIEASKNGHSTSCVKSICDIFRREVKLCRDEDVMSCPERKECMSDVINPRILTTFFKRCYQ